ncbi:MAG: hypothetical protein EZS28_038890, partial [Streblomastix strix]
VDIWSVGVALYLLITHKYPFESKNAFDLQQLYKKCQNERNGIIDRPSEIVDDNIWDLLIKLLDFNPIRRISAEKALKHSFFTSQQALSQITPQAKQIANKAQQARDKNITIYDTDSTYIVQTQEITRILKNDPEVEEQNIIIKYDGSITSKPKQEGTKCCCVVL